MAFHLLPIHYSLSPIPYFGGEDSQTEHAKIGTAVPYFPKVPFEASHLSFRNANIALFFPPNRRLSLLADFKRNILYFHFKIGAVGSKVTLLLQETRTFISLQSLANKISLIVCLDKSYTAVFGVTV